MPTTTTNLFADGDRHATTETVVPIASRSKFWGKETSLDIHNCNSELIRSKEAILKYVEELIKLIDMKAYFPPCEKCGESDNKALVVHFGEDEKVAGYSMVQLISTSLISAHFANATNRAYINIFSCKEYDDAQAADFTWKYFKGTLVKRQVNNRI